MVPPEKLNTLPWREVEDRHIVPFEPIVDGQDKNWCTDHTKQLDIVPSEVEPYASLFRTRYLDKLKPVLPFEFVNEGVTPKAFIRISRPRAKGLVKESQIYMLKPYHEIMNDCDYMYYPNAGWAEITMQGLYHAAGIGDLCQKVFADCKPVPWLDENNRVDPTKVQDVPLLVVVIEKNMHEIEECYGEPRLDLQIDGMKIAVLDFLSNNNDRHGGNLLFAGSRNKPTRLLAIDNGRSFNYTIAQRHQYNWSRKDHLYFYFRSPGLHPVVYENNLHHTIGVAMRWWTKRRNAIVAEFERQLSGITNEKARKWIAKNFKARVKTLDQFAVEWKNNPTVEDYDPGDSYKNKVEGDHADLAAVPMYKHTTDRQFQHRWS